VTHQGSELTLRRIVVQLLKPTRHGDTEVAVFTNLPPSVTALKIAELYRERWSVECLLLRAKHLRLSQSRFVCFLRGACCLQYSIDRQSRPEKRSWHRQD
jgi:hypothetical protein